MRVDRSDFRTDIQALRGFAVSVVVLYHAGIPGFDAGFFGVDVFFVISGFLITGLIARSISQGNFSFKAFYLRRARRLLPAAYVTFLATAILAHFLLGSPQLIDFSGQLAGGVAFLANVVLWRQSGYFEGAAELKPLLHVWSLSLEEQYYLLIPSLLFLLPKRFWLSAVVIVSLCSLVACLLLVLRWPTAAFFLLPTRAWELGIGSVAALVFIPHRAVNAIRLAFWPLLCVLVCMCLWRFDGPHPGWQALFVCLATAGIILGRHEFASSHQKVGPLAWIGGISYSLYLVHWPLFAFMHNAWLDQEAMQQPPLQWRLLLIAIAFILAWALHRFVEVPFRHSTVPAKRTVVRLVMASGVLVAVAALLPRTIGSQHDFAYELRPNRGFDPKCNYRNDHFKPLAECANSTEPSILVWGDSFAMHLVPGFAEDGADLVQATRLVCAPILGVTAFNVQDGYDEAWGKRCMAFGDSVLKYAAATPSIRYVVLSSPFRRHVDEGVLVLRGEQLVHEKPSIETVLSGLLVTVDELRRIGKKVIVIAPPPATGADFGRCYVHKMQRKWGFGNTERCEFLQASADQRQRNVFELLHRLEKQGVPVIDLRPALCHDGVCQTIIDDVPIYRDDGHLSIRGSEHLAKQMRWVERVKAEAR